MITSDPLLSRSSILVSRSEASPCLYWYRSVVLVIFCLLLVNLTSAANFSQESRNNEVLQDIVGYSHKNYGENIWSLLQYNYRYYISVLLYYGYNITSIDHINSR